MSGNVSVSLVGSWLELEGSGVPPLVFGEQRFDFVGGLGH